MFRPAERGGEYRIVYRFDSAQHLRRWLDSDERAAWLERAEPHAAAPMQSRYLTGLESWFTLPARPGAPPPPPWKMAILTSITIFPLITAIVYFLGPTLARVPLVPRMAISTAIAVPLMTLILMPRVTRPLRAWLYPAKEKMNA